MYVLIAVEFNPTTERKVLERFSSIVDSVIIKEMRHYPLNRIAVGIHEEDTYEKPLMLKVVK